MTHVTVSEELERAMKVAEERLLNDLLLIKTATRQSEEGKFEVYLPPARSTYEAQCVATFLEERFGLTTELTETPTAVTIQVSGQVKRSRPAWLFWAFVWAFLITLTVVLLSLR